MKALFITNMYPTAKYPNYGIHVKEQIDTIVDFFNIEHDVLFINGKKSRLNYLFSAFRLFLLLRSKRFDVIHVHYGITGLVLLFFPFLRIPIILTLHGSEVNDPDTLTRFIVTRAAKRCQKIIVMNDQMLAKIKSLNKSAEVIPCGVNLNVFRPEYTSVCRQIRIGFPSSPTRAEKNYALFESVVRILSQTGLEIETVIFDNLSRLQVVEKLNYINVLVLTSLNEGSPQIVKEALACNTPVVSVPVGDV
jgi:glycosyltransferase involved in cell wall biosynthesis